MKHHNVSLHYDYRVNNEIVCVKIYANGEKYDIGAGEQFNSISDLILYYKNCPLKTDKGVDIHLDQVKCSYIIIANGCTVAKFSS